MAEAKRGFFTRIGGRKQANGYLYAIMISLAVKPLGGSFSDYATWLAVALLGTSAVVAWEDRGRGA